MPITFAPERGRVLVCDFDMAVDRPAGYPATPADPTAINKVALAAIPAEMTKIRPVVVVSPTSRNGLHARGPGHVLVVPFSTVPPRTPDATDVHFAARSYPAFSRESWAKCALLACVSHQRLNRQTVFRKGKPITLAVVLSADDMDRIAEGICAAAGLP